jgi:hypothetical protein
MLERLVRDHHSSLLGLFISYEENEVFWILWRIDTQYNDIQHNDTHHNEIQQNDTQHNNK